MADLGMYEIMKKCLQFAVAPEAEESSDEEAMDITIEGETMDYQQHSMDMEVEPSETMKKLKATIQDEFGIPPSQLVLKCNGQELQNCDKTLGKAGIQDGDTLSVALKNIPLIVHSYGSDKEIPVQVTCRNTLQDIKTMVEPASGIPTRDQRLFRKDDSPNKELTDHDKTVLDYGFVDNEHLYLEPTSVSIRIQMPGSMESFDLELGLGDTSETIQGKIADKTGLELREFATLSPKTNKDIPAQKTVRGMKLYDGDSLNVKLHKIPVNVKRKLDKTLIEQLLVDPMEDTLVSMKAQLEESSGVDPAQMILFHGSKRLDMDSQTVFDMGLKADAILYLDTGPVEIKSRGEVYIALTVEIDKAPNENDYAELAKVTQDFYGKHLKQRWPKTFRSLQVACHRGMFRFEIPSDTYNVYVEWELTASFELEDPADEIPNRHKLCGSLAKAELMPFLTKVGNMPSKSPFSKTRGVYTQQTKSR
jgi:hypothetical protein